jgi:hypothetical protein
MKKFARITNVIGGLASQGRLFIGPSHMEFASQFEAYGPTYAGVDDDLDASALALQELHNPFMILDNEGREIETFANVEDIGWERAAP